MKSIKSEDIQKFLEKAKKLERGEKLDLSSDEDLSVGVMNLIAIEEHLFFTFSKTKNPKYLDLLNEVREMRKSLMKRLVKNPEGEWWCIAKHLLSTSMRLLEVGTKFLTKGEKKQAEELFAKSYHLYSLFWGLNLGVVKLEEIKMEKNDKINLISEEEPPKIKGEAGIFSKLGDLVKKIIDCCIE
ncbi:MAG: hypothetical protein ACPLKP_01855 [Microgenomates group bacterium]